MPAHALVYVIYIVNHRSSGVQSGGLLGEVRNLAR